MFLLFQAHKAFLKGLCKYSGKYITAYYTVFAVAFHMYDNRM